MMSRLQQKNFSKRTDCFPQVMAQKVERQMLKYPRKCKEKLDWPSVLAELDYVKKELSRLKLDVASALEAKAKAEKEIEASVERELSELTYAEELKEELDELNEEHVVVELARIEAERESRELEAWRKAEAAQFSNKIKETRRRIVELHEEIALAKDLEKKLAKTTSDVSLLQSEIELVREMERNSQKNNSAKHIGGLREQELEISSMLRSSETELTAAKKELGRIKEEGFKLMTAIDVFRRELLQIAQEMNHLRKREKITESTSHYLKSSLLEAKTDLDATLMSYERVKLIVSNMVAALQQLHLDTVAAKKKGMLQNNERISIEFEIEKVDSDIYVAEVRLELAMQELERVKASEATALEKLKSVAESTANARATQSFQGSTITITKFEYDYLSSRAEAAQEVADKKVGAARAWIAALEAEENEMLTEIRMIQRKLKECRLDKENKLCNTIEEAHNWRDDEEETEAANLLFALPTRKICHKTNSM